jgi:hypothetical protein
MNGGPSLHDKDKKLIQQNLIARESLITIRKGEPVFSPGEITPQWNRTEFIKLKGKPAQWTCIYYDEIKKSCSLYAHRPIECILLKCWDTVDLEKIAGKNLLNRLDIISSDDAVIQYINRHKNECSLEFLEGFNIDEIKNINEEILAELVKLVNKDLELRVEAVRKLNMNLDLELFYFGRPLFKILSQFGINSKEVNGKVILLRT